MEYLGLNVGKIAYHWGRSYLANWKYFFRHVASQRKAAARTRAYSGKYGGRSAFVFSNGPSLKLLDAKKIARLQHERGMHVFGVNSYWLSDFGREAKADFYVLSDPCHWDGSLSESELHHLAVEERSLRQKAFGADVDLLWRELREDSRVELFVPFHQYGRKKHPRQFAYCDSVSIYGRNVKNILRPLNYVSMTAYKALSIACYMGYEKIYIAGFDNSFFKAIHVNKNNEVEFQYVHGTSNGPSQRYAARGGWLSADNVGAALYNLHFQFTHLDRFKEFPIVNLDPQSMVTSFTKQHELDVYGEG